MDYGAHLPLVAMNGLPWSQRLSYVPVNVKNLTNVRSVDGDDEFTLAAMN